MIAQAEKKIHTAEDYLTWECNSPERHEFINGEIIPVTGGTPNHNELASIFNALLRISLRQQPYSIFIADQRVWILALNLYTYPDVMVVKRPLALQSGRADTIVNPLLIVEILSNSTKAYDRDEKFAAYRSIESFQEYLLIDQYRLQVEHYSKKAANQWIFSEYNHLEDQIILNSIPFQCLLADLYESIEF
ncbi:MAG: Uma2 family endonuclease [Snowella sp.]|nr:Uma2 family endonuclease [Snowella sp.]